MKEQTRQLAFSIFHKVFASVAYDDHLKYGLVCLHIASKYEGEAAFVNHIEILEMLNFMTTSDELLKIELHIL